MADIHERRRDPRQRSFLGASLAAGPGASLTACLVRNLGPEGARIEVSETLPLPANFPVTIGSRGETRLASLVWRKADAVGVRFVLDATAGEVVPLRLVRELRAVRAENARLRGRLAAAGLDD